MESRDADLEHEPLGCYVHNRNEVRTAVKKLKRSSLGEEAYSYVRELFLDSEQYRPGDKVNVEELSRGLGVSRTPLWGAINRLEAEGIVQIVPRQGVYLIDYDPGRVRHIFEAREALEGMAARLAAERATPARVAALRKSMDEQAACVAEGDTEGYYAAALGFHEKIADIARNPTLQQLLASVLAQLRVMRTERMEVPMRPTKFHDDHSRLVDAIERGDGAAAEREARKHIRDLAKQIDVTNGKP